MVFHVDHKAFNECFDKLLRELRHTGLDEIEWRAVSSLNDG